MKSRRFQQKQRIEAVTNPCRQLRRGSARFDTVLAEEGKGADEAGWRADFSNLVKKAKGLRQ